MKKQKNSLKRATVNLIDEPLAGDMSDFILEGIESSSWQVAKFELRDKKDKVFSLRLSEKLLTELKRQAKKAGLDTQKFIRIILESSIRRKAG
jgi:predicted DNA binding CopG/RHH family protein